MVKIRSKMVTKGSISDRLPNVLLSYRIMLQGTMKRAPLEIIFGEEAKNKIGPSEASYSC